MTMLPTPLRSVVVATLRLRVVPQDYGSAREPISTQQTFVLQALKHSSREQFQATFDAVFRP